MKIIFSVCLFLLCLTTFAQQDISKYLSTHHYAFSLDKGFDKQTEDTLKLKFRNYKLILQAEGGSHHLNIYDKLPFLWIKFLNTNFGVTHAFVESGQDFAVCANYFIRTGDSSFLYRDTKQYWQQYRSLNSKLSSNNQIQFFGIDFNRVATYLNGLRLLLPQTIPPENIKINIELIKKSDNSLMNCSSILKINSLLKKGLRNYQIEYQNYLQNNYKDFEKIIESRGTCKDRYKNRNYNLAGNFLAFDKAYNDSLYYGELGMAHTILKNKVAASIINNSPEFKDKVCVINLYCFNCTTGKENVSNWPLKNIDSDIQKYFLPFCTSDFTLFDLSQNIELTKKYRDYGQFLIIAKNQD